ncbi:UNVERIFIED_CONTAM: hypothetical protein Sradi_4246400 [Sesamum radiatum]|uniref:HMA domain-containing protein n=1 Tax=Sesamum radiatum TaxID=300843 RepID=A0AAW2P427_SESRA
MASVSAFSLSRPTSPVRPFSYPSSALSLLHSQFPSIKFQSPFFKSSAISCISSNKHSFLRPTKVRAVAEEEEALVPEEETAPPPASAAPDQPVSVAVSLSDVLTMFFQEGTMTDSAIPAVAKALEEVEGITDLKVQVLEGIASVELTKQTTVQATGVASNLVEIIQGSGFKLQTLNLSFQDEEDFS